MRPGSRIDQLRRNPHLIARIAHTAFQHIRRIELCSDLAQILILPLKLKRRRTPDDREPRDLRQQIQNLLRHPVPKILLILLLAHIGKWQHRNRLVRDRRHGRRLRSWVLRRPVPNHNNNDNAGDDEEHRSGDHTANRQITGLSFPIDCIAGVSPQPRTHPRRGRQTLPHCLR